jgi:UDP-glucose 4-epimerase
MTMPEPGAKTRSLSGKRVLLTGGAGFVGSNLARRLIAEGVRLTILDDLCTGRQENLEGLEGQLDLIVGSVTDREIVLEAAAESEIIFHLAARNIIASTRNPREDFETNIGGTLNVLVAARQYRPQRVVYTSSVSIYGNPEHLPINESDRISLLTPYAVSKYAGEGYCQAFYESYDVPTVTVRYSNVYGIGQDPVNPYCGVVSRFMKLAREGLPPEVHGDGQQTRDFTYVEDAVEATIRAAVSPRAEGEVFNVGTGIETSVNDLARCVLALAGVNVEKIRRTLRWVPQVTLHEGLRRTWQWFLAFGDRPSRLGSHNNI